MHETYARTARDIERQEQAAAEPYYHVEYCFVRGGEGPTLRCDIEVDHFGVFTEQMWRVGGVRFLKIELMQES